MVRRIVLMELMSREVISVQRENVVQDISSVRMAMDVLLLHNFVMAKRTAPMGKWAFYF